MMEEQYKHINKKDDDETMEENSDDDTEEITSDCECEDDIIASKDKITSYTDTSKPAFVFGIVDKKATSFIERDLSRSKRVDVKKPTRPLAMSSSKISPCIGRNKHKGIREAEKIRSKSFINSAPFPSPFSLETYNRENTAENITVQSARQHYQSPKKTTETFEAVRRSSSLRETSSSNPFISVTDNKSFTSAPDLSKIFQTANTKLPVSKKADSCNFISKDTLVQLMAGKFQDEFDHYVVVDCRYLYEFRGGHIKDAISIIPMERDIRLNELFLNNVLPHGDRIAVVFHCEFSSKRGPATCRRLRALDRALHGFSDDKLYYPNLFVMEGGYQEFFGSFKDKCIGGYVEMKDKRYKVELKTNKRQEREREKLRRSASVLVPQR